MSLPLKQLAQEMKQGESTVRAWVAAGCPHERGGGGRLSFDREAVVAWLRSMGRSGKPGRPVGSLTGARPKAGAKASEGSAETATDEPSTAELFKLTAAANLRIKELEAEKRARLERQASGELLEARAVEEAWAAEGQRLRAAFEGLPTRLSGQLVGLEKEEIRAQLAAAVRGVLVSLATPPGVTG